MIDHIYNTIDDIRYQFISKFRKNETVKNKDGSEMIELIGSSFRITPHENSRTIFGKVNEAYVQKELDWYNSLSLNVHDMEKPPAIWKQIADEGGYINSNYGWCIYSEENGNQYNRVVEALLKSPVSRQAVMIYNRPSMHTDAIKNGRSDFMCTNAVNYFIRGGALHSIVQMRSNDIIFGFRNDYAWQRDVQEQLALDVKAQVGNIYWNAASLHCYERHFWLLDMASRFSPNATFDVSVTDKVKEEYYERNR